MRKILLLSGMLALALVSCKREELPVANQEQGNNAVGFSAYSQKTKASVADISTLKNDGFGVYGIAGTYDPSYDADFFDQNLQEVTFGAYGWTYSPMRYWPSDNGVLSFIAFSPYSTKLQYFPAGEQSRAENLVNTGAKLGDFTVKNEIGSQIDLLVATKFNTPEVPKVVLEFKHVLSRIGFSAYAPGIEDGSGVTVNSIELKNATSSEGIFKANGALYVNTDDNGQSYSMVWGEPIYSSSVKQSFTLANTDLENNGTVTATPARLNKEDKYIMILPQGDLGSLKIVVNYTVGEEEKTKAFTCPVLAFEMGKAYTFNFNLGNSEVLFDCSVEDWDNSSYSLNAGSEVVAASSNPEFDVFIDAQKTTNAAGVAVTKYSLYAEIDTTSTGDAMLPVWKGYFDTGDGNGPVLRPLPKKYSLGSGELNTTTSEEILGDSRYLKLSFEMDESNKDVTSGTYFADYVEEPIKAATRYHSKEQSGDSPESGVPVAPSPGPTVNKLVGAGHPQNDIIDFSAITIERSYTANVNEYDYTQNAVVTLRINNYPGYNYLFNTWTDWNNEEDQLNATSSYWNALTAERGDDLVFSEWIAYDGDGREVDLSGSEFTLNEDNSLTFNEYYRRNGSDIVARHYTFYAKFVYESEAPVHIEFEDAEGIFEHPEAGDFNTDSSIYLFAQKPDEGIEFKWRIQNPAGLWSDLDFNGGSTARYGEVEFTQTFESAGGDSVDGEGGYYKLSFTPKRSLNGCIIGVKYGDPISFSVYNKDNNGKSLVEGTDYTITYSPTRGTASITCKASTGWDLGVIYSEQWNFFEIIDNNIYSENVKKLSGIGRNASVTWSFSTERNDWGRGGINNVVFMFAGPANLSFEDIEGFTHPENGKYAREITLHATKPTVNSLRPKWFITSPRTEDTLELEIENGEGSYAGVKFTEKENELENTYDLTFIPNMSIDGCTFSVKYGNPIDIQITTEDGLNSGPDYSIRYAPTSGTVTIGCRQGLRWGINDNGTYKSLDEVIPSIYKGTYTSEISEDNTWKYWTFSYQKNMVYAWTVDSIKIYIDNYQAQEGEE